jgi:serine/threonine protein kinase
VCVVQPQNILLTDKPPTGQVKICDLGLARYVHAGDDVREIMGTPDYVGEYHSTVLTLVWRVTGQ